MHSLGIIQVQDRLRWALVQEEGPVRLEESLTIPEEILSIKNLKIVTGLEGSAVLRRDLKLPLTSSSALKEALPFQIEPLIPFPLDQSVIFPQFHTLGLKETFVVVWASTQAAIQSHLEKWNSLGIDPDIISSETLALARWTEHFSPNERDGVIALYETLAVAINNDRIICAMESPDQPRLKQFLKQKYPLFAWVDRKDMDYALPIGLALEAFEKHPCQFRLEPSMGQKKQQRYFMKAFFSIGIGLTLITGLISSGIFYVQETKLKQKISYNGAFLEEGVQTFRDLILKETKSAPTVYNGPLVQDVLSWLSTLKASVDITHIKYELLEPTSATVSLEFKASSESHADLFIKQLQQSPIYELKWTSLEQNYNLSFQLRKSS
jgi:hypothetical protein